MGVYLDMVVCPFSCEELANNVWSQAFSQVSYGDMVWIWTNMASNQCLSEAYHWSDSV
jgi:hypothetical protein